MGSKVGKARPSFLEGCDAVIHLSGAGIGDKRWSDAYRKEILDSRTATTSLLANTIASLQRKPSVFLSGSAIGIYGARGDEQLTETSEHGTGFLADVCEQWEAAAKPAIDAGVRTVFLRTGIVLSPKGGALKNCCHSSGLASAENLVTVSSGKAGSPWMTKLHRSFICSPQMFRVP